MYIYSFPNLTCRWKNLHEQNFKTGPKTKSLKVHRRFFYLRHPRKTPFHLAWKVFMVQTVQSCLAKLHFRSKLLSGASMFISVIKAKIWANFRATKHFCRCE